MLKPGGQIEIQFKAYIPDCASATDYYNGSRQAQAEVLFDKPCDHANMGDPLSLSSLNMVTELPANANVDVLVQSRNPSGAPWNGAWTNSVVWGEKGQTLEWKVRLSSNGDGSAPVVTLKDILPPNVTYVGWSNVGAESTAGVSMNFVSGDGTAGNLTFNLALGNGYQAMARISGTAEDSLAGNVATWNRGTVTLAPGASLTWVYSAQVKTGGGDLRAIVSVNGYCVDLNGTDVCQYNNDQSIGYLAGAEVRKTIASVNTPASITNAPTNTTADATHGNAITYTIEAHFSDNGPYTSVALTDTLPANMTYVSAVPAPNSVAGQVLTWNLTGGTGTVNGAQNVSITVIARVANAANRGDVLTNTAALSFVHHGVAFNAGTHPANLAKTTSVTVIASRFRTADLQKTAVPVGTPTQGPRFRPSRRTVRHSPPAWITPRTGSRPRASSR